MFQQCSRRFALLAVLSASAAHATVRAAGAQGADAELTFASSLAGNPVAGGIYVGPYSSLITPAVGQARTVSVICVDFLNHVNFNDRYEIAITGLGNALDPLTDTRHPRQMASYRKAAWMSSLFATAPTSDWGSIHFAIWNVFTPAQAPDDAWSPYIAQVADVAASNNYGAFDYGGVHYAAVDMSRYSVLTDVAATGLATGGHQEFITSELPPSITTPEPATIAFVATGLGIAGLAARNRRRDDDPSLE